jgi:hypothetical protein
MLQKMALCVGGKIDDSQGESEKQCACADWQCCHMDEDL